MFRLRLHPTPSGFALGLAVIALWALLWVWFLAQLAGGPRPSVARTGPGSAQMTAVEIAGDVLG